MKEKQTQKKNTPCNEKREIGDHLSCIKHHNYMQCKRLQKAKRLHLLTAFQKRDHIFCFDCDEAIIFLFFGRS
jgi:hypothetical protein